MRRSVARFVGALAAVIAVLGSPALALAVSAQQAVADADEALSARPPRPQAARAALVAATTANDDPDAASHAYFLLGKLDEDDGAFARALADDRASVATAPSGKWAWRASERIAWLDARSEGGFAPLALLERMRRDPAASDDPGALEALSVAADTFPPGPVRVEARLLAAEAWRGRLHRPGEAMAELRKVTGDPAADALSAGLAERELVDLLVAEGRLDDASREARDHADRLDPPLLAHLRRLVRRRWLRLVAVAELAAFLALAAAAIARAGPQRIRDAYRGAGKLLPVAATFVAYVALVGGLLASRYESGTAAPFLLLGVVALPLVLIARAWAAVGSSQPGARRARSLVCAASVLAAAFVLLDAVNPSYLEGFGL